MLSWLFKTMRRHGPHRPAQLVALAVLAVVSSAVAEPASTPAPRNALAQSNADFALDLYAKLAERPGNVVVSPLSVSTCLAMLYGGARGETQSSMARALHIELDQEALPAAYADLLSLVRHLRSDAIALDVANGFWVDRRLPVHAKFAGGLAEHYGADAQTADFVAGADEARAQINDWVESKTRGKIHDLLGPSWPSETVAVALVNAAYFRGDWASPFVKQRTEVRPFFALEGDTLQVQTMRRQHGFRFCSDAVAEVLELPYVGKNVSMLIVLPQLGTSVRDLRLTRADVASWDAALRSSEVYVELPRFSFEWGGDISGVLVSMGMASAFSEGAADFTGISDVRPMWLSQVVHGALVRVDETGTEAAAATVAHTTLGVSWDPVAQFKVNRPFVFLIREHLTGSILFVGRVERPEE